MSLEWTLYELCGYWNTWSAVKKFIERNENNPVVELAKQLALYWGKPELRKLIKYPLFLKAGKFRNEDQASGNNQKIL